MLYSLKILPRRIKKTHFNIFVDKAAAGDALHVVLVDVAGLALRLRGDEHDLDLAARTLIARYLLVLRQHIPAVLRHHPLTASLQTHTSCTSPSPADGQPANTYQLYFAITR